MAHGFCARPAAALDWRAVSAFFSTCFAFCSSRPRRCGRCQRPALTRREAEARGEVARSKKTPGEDRLKRENSCAERLPPGSAANPVSLRVPGRKLESRRLALLLLPSLKRALRGRAFRADLRGPLPNFGVRRARRNRPPPRSQAFLRGKPERHGARRLAERCDFEAKKCALRSGNAESPVCLQSLKKPENPRPNAAAMKRAEKATASSSSNVSCLFQRSRRTFSS